MDPISLEKESEGSVSRTGVLILVENLPVPLDRRVWQEACALRDAGYQVTVICPRMRGYWLSEEECEGIQIYRHWITEEAGGVTGFLGEYASALWGELLLAWKAWWRHRFRIIHLCNPPDLLFLAALPFRLLGVRVIYDVHDVWPEMYEAKFGRRGLFYWVIRTAERLTYATADRVLATNESVRQVALTRGRKRPTDVLVVRTAPKITDSEVEVDPRLKGGRRFLIGYIGVMGSSDGVDYILDAAADLIHKRGWHCVQFLLMGTGPEYDRLLEKRDSLELQPWVAMPGRVSNDYLFTALKTMDLGVSGDPKNAYNDHCTMNKVLEYMAFGKPQVMFDLQEGRASADEAAAYVPESSGKAMAAAIERLLTDPQARERMGRLGQERIRSTLKWQRSVDQLLKAYSGLSGKGAKSGQFK